jgi:glycerol-3-phosphate dehydrogenase subunit B
MFERVVVIGAGAAGLAATWAATQRGAEIRLYDPTIGASCLHGGAVDDRPWEQVARATEVLQLMTEAGPLPEAVRSFARDLGLWRLPKQGEPLCRLATEAGRIRLARGHDRSMLDVAQLPTGARVLLPQVVRAEWDAHSLAASLNADAYAQSRRMVFEAIDAKVLKHVGEDRIAAARRFYNANVRDMNQLCESFPSNLVASMFGFEKQEQLQIDTEVRETPEVDFDFGNDE